MVVQLREQLTQTQDKLDSTAAELYQMQADGDAFMTEVLEVRTRLAVGESEVRELKMENAAQESRLATSETEVQRLKMENAAQATELTAVQNRLAATETAVESLERGIQEAPKVAFSAALTDSGFVEAGDTDMDLFFNKTIINVGQAYSSTTGFFTAPVKGVYYFRFTVMDGLRARKMSIRLLKNKRQVMYLAEVAYDGYNTYLSSGVTLELEVGDVVNMRLPAGCRLCDSSSNHSTFSGFLVFAL
ncbi:hypothetical protein ACEWY4_020285 [Coilia grayii]|uniref:C1q domain-containing protein n=1 Tax=Coilia grayii TaxID=363190 RepID=A0ABD1JC86_9TELE